ncbi:MAG: cell filamentation protein Fic [Deltaproteobacteria bacterium RIFCSPLOWO2_12_55_13]|nr:MAG: cell filamentation protein Fic [Deltaproteobacteria bacterium RIFCSPLOWO2_12_55_13]
MRTLQYFASKPETVPASTSWYLADLGEARGKQELFTKQSPQRLKVLREHALIESAVSSNRIEGVNVDKARIATVIFGKPVLRDRDEEEVRGYRDALKLIHEQGAGLPVSEETLKKLHRLTRGDIWDAGKYKDKDADIIEKYPDGRERVRFKAVPAAKTKDYMQELVELWSCSLRERWVHSLIALAAFNLDFLCIHPFRDGNGRVSRLLLLLQCYHLGFEVGRYISLDRLIEENKERYYETLERSSQGWHEGKHDPWPYVNYLLFILKNAYKEFEERVGQTASPKGAKTELVTAAIRRFPGSFRVSDIQRECPGVSVDLIRQVLKNLRSVGRVKCLGRGQSAEWERTGRWK